MTIRRTSSGATTTAPVQPASNRPNGERSHAPAAAGRSQQRAGATIESKPTHEQVAKAAYFLWIEKGRPSGCDNDIWCEAEQRLTRR